MPTGDTERSEPLARLGAAIRATRIACGMTQAELAEQCDVHVNYLSLLERGRRNPTATMLLTLAAALSVAPGDLFRDIGVPDLRLLLAARSKRGKASGRRHR